MSSAPAQPELCDLGKVLESPEPPPPKKTQQILGILNCRRTRIENCVALTGITEERRKDSYDQEILPTPGQETSRQPP